MKIANLTREDRKALKQFLVSYDEISVYEFIDQWGVIWLTFRDSSGACWQTNTTHELLRESQVE